MAPCANFDGLKDFLEVLWEGRAGLGLEDTAPKGTGAEDAGHKDGDYLMT